MDAAYIPKSPLAVHLGLSSVELRKTLAIASESNQHSFMLSTLTQAIGIVEEIKAELQMKAEKDKFESDMKNEMKKDVDRRAYNISTTENYLEPTRFPSSQSIAEAFNNRTWG